MKIAVCTTFSPFIRGGDRNIVSWLKYELEQRGHIVDTVILPQVDSPATIIQQIMALRWIDLSSADQIICLRPQAHLISHPHKIIWFLHHLRPFYDLWDSPYRGFPNDLRHQGIRDLIRKIDSKALREAKTIFTNSQAVSKRLKEFNQIESSVLYPPIFKPQRFFSSSYGNEIVCLSRINRLKRQHLLIEAVSHTKSPVRLKILGECADPQYTAYINNRISELGVDERVTFNNRWISEEEKIIELSNCLASAYIPYDEDSYGYQTIEAALSFKPTLTASDSGGTLEFVKDGDTGYVADPEAISLARSMDRLYRDVVTTQKLGRNANRRITELGLSWDEVIRNLTK